MSLSFSIFAYGSLVGLSLGLIGSGGSIFAIPILIYGFGLPMSQAILVSLLVVAIIAIFGSGRQSLAGNVDWHAAILFSSIGAIISPLTIYLAHSINETLRLVFFSVLMLFISYTMSFCKMGKHQKNTNINNNAFFPNVVKTAAGSAAVGVLSGFFGVGGGFVIVPLLIMIFDMPYQRVVGTSLASIFMISTTTIVSSLFKGITIDWLLFFWFASGGLAGMLGGSFLLNIIPERIAKIAFSLITAVTAVLILVNPNIA